MKKVKGTRKEQFELGLLAVTAASQVLSQYTNIKEKVVSWNSHRRFTVTLLSDDPAYDDVMDALLEFLPHIRQKAVSVAARRQRTGALKVFESWSARRNEKITINGHEIIVGLEENETKTSTANEDVASLIASMRPDTLKFWCKSYEGKQAVLGFLHGVVDKSDDNKPKLWSAARWGDWRDQSEVPHRSLESVVLRKGIVDDIANDLRLFLQQEEAYARIGLPWHRGYLLYGCPGSGKTSLVRALASHLGIDLYVVSIPGIRDDQTLTNLLSSVQPRSALLIEDIDTVQVAKNRDVKKLEGVSMSGLLNALDGVGTPHGLITFLTSNHRSRLDKALLRPGRCDRTFKIGYVDDDQLARMVEVYHGERVSLPPVPTKLAPATVIEVYKENLETPDRFVPALIRLLEE